MKKIILCSLALGLIACNDIKTILPNSPTVENKAQVQKVESQSKRLLPKDSKWQFDKFIYVTDENLKKLDNGATVTFIRGDNNLGSVGVYSGCNEGGTVIEFDDKNARTLKPKLDKKEGYLSTAIGCNDYDWTESTFIAFITNGNVYEFQGENLILTDIKGQKIQFKPYVRNNENSNVK